MDVLWLPLLYYKIASILKLVYYKIGLSSNPDPPPGSDLRKLTLRRIHSKKVSAVCVIRSTHKRELNAGD